MHQTLHHLEQLPLAIFSSCWDHFSPLPSCIVGIFQYSVSHVQSYLLVDCHLHYQWIAMACRYLECTVFSRQAVGRRCVCVCIITSCRQFNLISTCSQTSFFLKWDEQNPNFTAGNSPRSQPWEKDSKREIGNKIIAMIFKWLHDITVHFLWFFSTFILNVFFLPETQNMFHHFLECTHFSALLSLPIV